MRPTRLDGSDVAFGQSKWRPGDGRHVSFDVPIDIIFKSNELEHLPMERDGI